jgi:hypothetical protein
MITLFDGGIFTISDGLICKGWNNGWSMTTLGDARGV